MFAWECDPKSLKCLRTKKFSDKVQIIPKAISDTTGKENFNISYFKNDLVKPCPCSSLMEPIIKCNRPKIIKFKNSIKVFTDTLDRFCEENNIYNIDLIWADIQGAERKMLEGAKRMLKNTKFIVMELISEQRYKSQICSSKKFQEMLPNWQILRSFNTDIIFKNQGVEYE